MSVNTIFAPYPLFTDDDGDPLESGYLYVGVSGQNAETAPIEVYWDDALTQPAAQPIRTLNGYPSRNGKPNALYTSGAYSIVVRDRSRALVFADDDAGFRIVVAVDREFDDVAALLADTTTGYVVNAILRTRAEGFAYRVVASGEDVTNAGGVKLRVLPSSDGVVSIAAFGAPDDGTNISPFVQSAVDAGYPEVVIPSPAVGYGFSNRIVIPPTLRILRGVGKPKIKALVGGVNFIAQTAIADFLVTGIAFEGPDIGGAETSSNDCLSFENCTDIRVENCQFTNCFRRPIEVRGGSRARIAYNDFITCSNGPFMLAVKGAVYEGNTVRGSQQADGTFKVGIGVGRLDAIYGNATDVQIIDNQIDGIQNGQAILVHSGERVTISGNTFSNTAQGISLNNFSGGIDIIREVSITGNVGTGIGAGAAYTPLGENGILLGGAPGILENVTIYGNSLRNYNLTLQQVNSGGIALFQVNNVSVSANMIAGCGGNGVSMAIGNCNNIRVEGNIVTNGPSTGAFGGIKVAGNAIVTGIITSNIVKDCDRSVRLESICPDLVVNDDSFQNNRNVAFGRSNVATYNRAREAGVNEATPSVKYGARVLKTNNSSPTTITNFADGFRFQSFVLIGDANTTIRDASSGSAIHLQGNANKAMSNRSTMQFVYTGTEWWQVSEEIGL